jgi:hypothetical protein
MRVAGLGAIPTGRVLRVGLAAANGTIEQVCAGLAVARAAEVSALARGVRWFPAFVNASVLLGGLGTLFGMSIGFGAHACYDASSMPAALCAAR